MTGRSSSSRKILVQVGTTERPLGWKTKPVQVNGRSGEEVISFGRAPWMIVNSDVTLALKNSEINKAHVLDANGMAVKEVPLAVSAGRKTLKFPANALYVGWSEDQGTGNKEDRNGSIAEKRERIEILTIGSGSSQVHPHRRVARSPRGAGAASDASRRSLVFRVGTDDPIATAAQQEGRATERFGRSGDMLFSPLS